MNMKSKFIKKISEITSEDFSKISNDENYSPFFNFEFLKALEDSKSVSEESGWISNHLAIFNKDLLEGFMPIYLKNNSQGEFVFDHQWSYALTRAGRNYYPKLLTAIPYTPCETNKILKTENIKYETFILETKKFMEKEKIETWHILFPALELHQMLLKNNFIKRSGYKFIWGNKDYKTFDDYLNIFTSRQRKNIRNERDKIKKAGISFIVKDKNNLASKDWDDFYHFYKNTYYERMQKPYLNLNFFKLIHEKRHELNPVIFFAMQDDINIAASLCFNGKSVLYGRHWGALKEINSLHFECCYYQGIDYCIKNNISYFDPGVQGEHKIRRGFEVTETSSFHLIIKDDFKDAIKNFCEKEREEILRYIDACKKYTPIKKEYKI